jgi:hypothetical protein
MMTKETDLEVGIWLIGLRFDVLAARRYDNAEIYTLVFEAKNEEPIVNSDKVVFFTSPEHARAALLLEGDSRLQALPVPTEVHYVYDLQRAAIDILSATDDVDLDNNIVNSLNLLFDCIGAVGQAIPDSFRADLFALADHLTFNNTIDDFLEKRRIGRRHLYDGFLWCVGALAIHSTLVP